jgi:hypothetical protein
MKAIILVALFAFAANAFNYTAYNLGTAQQLGLSASQMEAGIPCSNALSGSFSQFVQLVMTKNVTEILSEVDQLYVQLQTDLKVTCLPYIIDYAAFFAQHTNETDLVQTMKNNFAIYFPEVFQQVAMWADYLIAGQDFQAGQAKGVIAQILFGLIKPETIPVPQVNVSQVSAYNQTKFVAEFIPSMLNSLGFNMTIDTDALNQCISEIGNMTQEFAPLIHQFAFMPVANKIQTVSSIFNILATGIQSCEYGIEIYIDLVTPMMEAFFNSPATFMIKFFHNYFLNFPEIVNIIQSEEVAVIQGQYQLAGQLAAEQVLREYAGIVNFGN